jgi:multiple sugar transport system ATP-binding protein
MATIELKQVEKKFGEAYAVRPMDLTISDGELVVLLGPSGCGKTTTLRMISGLETVTAGEILLDGRNVTWLHPSARDIAFVFQFYALYPHINVRDNISFPLRAQGESKEVIDQRVRDVVELLRIPHLLGKRPGGLSGGDKQRVALARALVRRPAAFLMDEPLGALDADLRETMRAEIRALQLRLKATTVYVTHDQIEAMAMGDRIVVMNTAVVQQVGTPTEVYYNPANLFVAKFIGSPGMNLIHGAFEDGAVRMPGGNAYSVTNGWRNALARGENVIIGFRPESAHVNPNGALHGEVYATDMHGSYNMLHVNTPGDEIVHVRADRSVAYPIGTAIRFDIDQEMVRFFNPQNELAMRRSAPEDSRRSGGDDRR